MARADTAGDNSNGATGPAGDSDARRAFYASAPPSLANLAHVAEPLGGLRDRIVFIGGAIAPLLQTEPPFARVRPTRDVDAIAASTSYVDANEIREALGRAGFRSDTSDAAHMHRWIAPDDDATPFDLVPAGAHPGGSGSTWDRLTIDTAIRRELYPGLSIQHASAPAFLALKWAAHNDRGMNDPRQSHDLEDLLALIASRPTLLDEVRSSPTELHAFIAEEARRTVADPDIDEWLDAHLNNAEPRRAVISGVRAVLRELAE